MRSDINYSDMVRKLAKDGEAIRKVLTPMDCHLWHMATLAMTEVGELADAIKAHVIYRRPLNMENVLEELGDLEFALEGIRQAFGITREDVIDANTAKLAVRYEGFTYSDDAANRRADKDE